MKFFFFFFVQFFIAAVAAFSQNKNAEYSLYSAELAGNVLTAYDKSGSLILKRSFTNPSEYSADLDGDGYNEYTVIDSISINGDAVYKIFIFNSIGNFSLVDSISSGKTYPAFEIINETGEVLIVTGNSYFDKYNSNSEFFFSPVNCWIYEDSQIILCNEEAYEFIMSENDAVIDFLENYRWQGDGCTFSKEMIGALASVYVNFINIGEKAKADRFLKKYYLCTDYELLKAEFHKLLEFSQ